jgi:integrase
MPTLSAAVASFLAQRRLEGVSDKTHDLYVHWFGFWRRWRAANGLPDELATVTIDELRQFFTYARFDHVRPHRAHRGLSVASLDALWRLLSSLWHFCDGEGWLLPEQAKFFSSKRLPRPRRKPRIHDTYDPSVLDALLAACIGAHHPQHAPDPEQEARDQALLLLVADTGMRIGELCSLHDRSTYRAEMQAIVDGKTGPRWVFWRERTAAALDRYLEMRSGPPNGPLLRSTWGQRRGVEGITTDAVRALYKRLAARAGVELIPNAPVHGWRSTFIQDYLDDGGDVSDVQQLVGHEDIRTTMIYAKANATRLRRKYDRIRNPKKED